MLNDLRYSVRTLWRSRLFSLSAVLTLALGIGATTAVFCVVEAVLLRPLPYANPDRLVRIWETNASQGIEKGDVSPGSLVDWRERARSLERVALLMPRDWMIEVNGAAETVHGATVSPALFPMLGVNPQMGRTFRPESEQTAPFGDVDEVVISHSLWQRAYGGRADVVGQTLVVEGRYLRRIAGVMPVGFAFPAGTEVWRGESRLRPVGTIDRTTRYYEAIGQLKPGVSLDQARAELALLAKQMEEEQPSANKGYGVRIDFLDESIVGGARTRLSVLLAMVACVLLIACANVASLLLARAASLRHDVAVRLALGAHWTRILRQCFADSLVLATLGSILGCLLGLLGVRLLVAIAPGDIPRLDEIGFGGPILLFAAALALVAALFTSLPPVLQARRLDVQDTLKSGGRSSAVASSRALRGWLIGAEVALTLVLLVGCMLLLRSFIALRGVDVGFEGTQVLSAELRLGTNRFADPNRRPWFQLAQYYDRLIADLGSMPGVVAVGGITVLPLAGDSAGGTFWFGTRATSPYDATHQLPAELRIVTPRYLDAMSVPLRQGRGFTDADRFDQPTLTLAGAPDAKKPFGVVLVNEAFMRRYISSGDPLGRMVYPFDHQWVEGSAIVGVVGDVRDSGIASPPEPTIYIPFGEMPGFRLTLTVRTTADPSTLAPMLRDRLKSFDPQMMVSHVRSMDEVVGGALSRPRFNLTLLLSFALTALALSATGIYGVVAFLVANRTREIGVRIAIGARSGDVLRLVLKDGLAPVAMGIAAGLLLSLMGVNALRSLLYGVLPFDPPSFVVAALLLFAVALAAAAIPANRASRVDPTIALRHD